MGKKEISRIFHNLIYLHFIHLLAFNKIFFEYNLKNNCQMNFLIERKELSVSRVHQYLSP